MDHLHCGPWALRRFCPQTHLPGAENERPSKGLPLRAMQTKTLRIKGALEAALRGETLFGQSGNSEQKRPLTLSLGPTLADFLNIQQFSFGLEASFEPWFCQICEFSDSVLIDYCAHHKMTEKHSIISNNKKHEQLVVLM